jgi:dipeptidase
MPLFIQPYKKLSAFDVMNMMNSHYEGTDLDATRDVGAGLFGGPHRPRPLTWEFEGKTYFNERTIAIERTGWNFVAQLRPHMPRELSVLIWFAADDTSTSPRVPVYACSTKVAEPYAGKGTQDGVPAPMMKLDLTKAFWVQNMVSNLVYWRWKDAYPIARKKIDDIYFDHLRKVQATDLTARTYYKKDPKLAIEYATNVTVKMAESLHHRWMDFYGELFVRFRDFSTIVADKENTRCGCQVQEPGLSPGMMKRIVMETGTHYEVTDKSPEGPTRLRSYNQDNFQVKAIF